MIFGQPNFNQFCLSVSLVVWLFAGSQGLVSAHEYEDGFIERSLTITIRDGVGYGEYQIGLNSKTAKQIIELAEQQEIVPQQTNEVEVAPSGLPAREKSTQAVIEKEMEAGSGIPTKPTLKESSPTQDSVKGSAPLSVGEHLTDLATIKRFGELRQHWFTDRLNLTNDGLPIELSKVSVEPAARHPFSVLVKFQFLLGAKKTIEKRTQRLSSTEAGTAGGGVTVARANSVAANTESKPLGNRVVDFLVTDRLFSDYHGATRYALRSRGATMLLQSNVAPALVRAERAELDRDAARAILAERLPVIRAKLSIGSR